MLLAVSIGFVTITETAQISNDLRKKTNNRKLFSKYASPKEKAILQTITELAKSKKTFETREIGEAVKTQTGKTVKPETLLEILNRLEEYGYIQKTVLSTNGQPKLVWKSKY
jgi:Fe2+ or Zn2+ uptake regulation protein